MRTGKYFFIYILFSLCFSGFANGRQEGNYSEAAKLLKEKKQHNAIDEALNIFEKNPASFNRALALTEKAMAQQNAFEKQFYLLLDQLYKEPGNTKKILAIIEKLERMNKETDSSVSIFLANLKTSTNYAENRIRFNRIMDEGIELIRKGLYTEAAEKFSQGYSIYYESYKEANEGTPRLSQTDKAIEDIRSNIEKFKPAEKRFLRALSAYRSSYRSGKNSIDRETIENLEAEISKMRELGAAVFRSGNVLQTFYSQDERSGALNQESFLPFAFRLTRGRTNAQEFEGVSGAFEAALLNRLNSLKINLSEIIGRNINRIYDKVNFENNVNASSNIARIEFCIGEIERLIRLSETSKNAFVRFPENTITDRKTLSYISALTNNIKETVNLYSSYIKLSRHDYFLEDYEQELKYLRDADEPYLISLRKEISDFYFLRKGLEDLQVNLESLDSDKFSDEKQGLSAIHISFLEKINSHITERYVYYAKIKNDSGVLAVQDNEKEFSKIPQKQSRSKKGETEGYKPSVIAELLNTSNLNLKTDIEALENASQYIFASGIEMKKNSSLKNDYDGIKYSEAKLKKLQSSLEKNLSEIKNDILKIDLAKREADFRYNEAKRAADKGNFADAREHINISQERTNEALRLEDNPEYRAASDERLAALGKEVNRRENEVVVRDVRRYIDSAKRMYFSGNFDSAESTLMTAKRRWLTTNIEENEEIENWISITQTAGIMKTGRTIPKSAPLYPQMTQLLNNAKQLYNEAGKKINSGQRQSALKDLNSARKNIKQVLLIYPINEQAGLLNLKIDKLIDPANFNSILTSRIKKLHSEYKRNPQGAYGQILDLYALDRDFPGLLNLKDEVEIYMGIKIIPPDTTALKKSAEYTAAAKSIYLSGNRSRFAEAIEKLDAAIKLDANNDEAAVIKDRIQTTLGGTAIAVLSAANEEKYKQAILELQRGNKLTAIALVEQLLKDPEGRRSAKVYDLKTRIDSQL